MLVAGALAVVGMPAASLLAIGCVLLFYLRSERAAQDQDLGECLDDLERKNVELRLREQQALELVGELESLNDAKDGYMSTISHELRTPLTSIRAYSEILSEFTADESPEARNEFLRVISGESERLTRLVDDLLDLARMESGVEHWEPELVDLRRVLELCLVCLGGLTIEKLVTFTLHAERSHVVEGNADRLQQAFTNVLANAWRFSPAGADIEVTLTGQGPRCTVLVRDRGPGVAEDLRERVFDRFMRDNRGTDPGDGSSTGLGLSITREIVARHRGRIWCENHPDGGAVFAIDLPRATAVGASLDDR